MCIRDREVVDRSDWVFAALLPAAAEDVIRPLKFAPEKHFINLVATLSLKRAEELIGPRKIIADVELCIRDRCGCRRILFGCHEADERSERGKSRRCRFYR